MVFALIICYNYGYMWLLYATFFWLIRGITSFICVFLIYKLLILRRCKLLLLLFGI